MNKLTSDRRTQIIRCLTEGNSVRATCRITDTDKGAVLKLLADIGTVCRAYMDEHLRDLSCELLQCDETWAFCSMKEKNVPKEFKGKPGYGDTWCFIGMDSVTKLVPAFRVGSRSYTTARDFMLDLASRIPGRCQITTDSANFYINAVERAFGSSVDYGMLHKIYGSDPESERRYSPQTCIGIKKQAVSGDPKFSKISTSHVERLNLDLRMKNRRYTRLTNCFSRKIENLNHSLALHFFIHNYCRIHGSLRVTPAMAAGVSKHIWELEEVVALLEVKEKAA